jgi:hypothetical protein
VGLQSHWADVPNRANRTHVPVRFRFFPEFVWWTRDLQTTDHRVPRGSNEGHGGLNRTDALRTRRVQAGDMAE